MKKKEAFTLEKSSLGIYYIDSETFDIQIIIIPWIPLEENLYLRYLTNNLQSTSMTNRLAEDYAKHQYKAIYMKYFHQLSIATLKSKGEPLMVCEGLLNLFDSSSEEIIARAKQEDAKYYLPKLNGQSAEIDHLKNILKQHNISFE